MQLRDVYESDTHIFLIQELCAFGTLEDLLRKAAGPLSEVQVARLFRGVVKSVLHCHQQGILHRDIKPENFLLAGSSQDAILRFMRAGSSHNSALRVKLADFGLSCFYRRGVPEGEAVGSPYYMAPEMVTPGSGGYGPAADLFSCGVILYHLLTGNFPFPGNTTAEIFHALRHYPAEFASPAFRSVSPAARHLMRRLLEKDPSNRIDAQDVLTHEWMTTMIGGSPTGPVQAAGPEAAASPVGNSPADSVGPSTAAAGGGAAAGSSGGGPRTASDATTAQTNSDTSSLVVAGLEAAILGAAGPAAADPEASGSEAASPEAGQLRSRAGDQFISARVFFMPVDERPRLRLQGFLDTFKRVEKSYQRLLRAPDADAAALHWEDVCLDLMDLNDYLLEHASREGLFFLGDEPSIAEAATAPALFRMAANLDAVRHIELLPACEALGLSRLAAWIEEVLTRPAEVCDVACLPPHVYVEMARKLHVRYEGPPSPVVSSSSPSSPVASPSAINLRLAPPPRVPRSTDSALDLMRRPKVGSAAANMRRDSADGLQWY